MFVGLRQVLNESDFGEELIYKNFHPYLKELGLLNYAEHK